MSANIPLCLSVGSTPAVRPTMLQAAKRGAGSSPSFSFQIPRQQNATFTVCRGWRYCPAQLPSIRMLLLHPLLADGQQPTANRHGCELRESGGKNNGGNAKDKPPSSVHHPPAGSVRRGSHEGMYRN